MLEDRSKALPALRRLAEHRLGFPPPALACDEKRLRREDRVDVASRCDLIFLRDEAVRIIEPAERKTLTASGKKRPFQLEQRLLALSSWINEVAVG